MRIGRSSVRGRPFTSNSCSLNCGRLTSPYTVSVGIPTTSPRRTAAAASPSEKNPVTTGEVLSDLDARERPAQHTDVIGLVRRDLEHQRAARLQPRGRLADDALD